MWLANTIERIIYACFWTLGLLIHIVPFPVRDAIAGPLSLVWFYLIRFRRRIVLHNLALVFPREREEGMGVFQERCEKLAIRNLRHTIHSFLEILERFHLKQSMLGGRLQTEGMNENIRPLLDRKQGFFFLTAHLGNWELITMVGVFLGIPLAILTKRLRNAFFDRIWVRSRKRFGLNLLDESGSGLGIARAIKGGQAVGFILDQHTGEPHGIESEFMGVKAWCPKGLAILSHRLQCPITPAYILRQKDGSFMISMLPPLRFPLIEENAPGMRTESGSLTEAGIRYHIQVCNENMEQWILKAPEQYLWLHRRFKNILDYRSPLPWEL